MKCLVVALDKLFLIVPAWRRGKRAGLITPRSLDRNGLPVSLFIFSDMYVYITNLLTNIKCLLK